MWFDEAVFYQIYPLGFCGAERENDFGETRHRFSRIEREIPRLRALGVTAVLFNPLFESERHGYDTVDFFRADRRLGTNEELASLVEKFHEAGIRVLFDGVFHHVGRAFPAFRKVMEERERAATKDWFYLDFYGDSPYGDGFRYADWEGHAELVKLNLENGEVQNYLMDAVRFWIRNFGIDGLRLDVCYLFPPWFLELLRRTVSAEKEDFFLVGEVIHCTSFAHNLSPARLDSITDYECYKGMISAFNSRNLFEIEYSLTRLFGDFPWSLYRGKRMLNFVDNHDVDRAYTALADKRNLLPLYTLLFTMPGMPCVYYGSEFGAEGDKRGGDEALRPCIDEIDKGAHAELSAHIGKLAAIRKASRALSYGGYEKVALSNEHLAFVRRGEGEEILAAVNIGEREVVLSLGEGTAEDLLTGEHVPLGALVLAPHASYLFRCL